ncbi:hypothetical protein DCAR_0934420 [Daucus carota subsp. sativus]|uniref:Uncharacterized protein n=1 Tax=Daucus carota subsp. sativus TaxID=79200 RepID=A0A175YFT3_DAUCS|nr:hypothetical protein DCAR_0934420 [Daucus carota subsp. sativus]
MNSAASHMAEYGLLNLSDPFELPRDATLGNLQFILDRDMGHVINNPEVVVVPLMRLGEVIDGTLAANLTRTGMSMHLCLHLGVLTPPAALATSKGKGKHYENHAFFENGSLSDKAIAAFDSGALLHFSSCFREKTLDLKTPVGNEMFGLYAKDVLHHTCLDTLGLLESMFLPAPVPPPQPSSPFMSTDLMLYEMGLESSPVHVGNVVSGALDGGSLSASSQRGRRAASV